MIIIWIILGFALISGIASLIFSEKNDPKERAQEAANTATTSAIMSVGCLAHLILSALPLAVAILIVIWVLDGCT